MHFMASYETRRFSRAEYDKLIEIGFFQPSDPIELIGGELMVAEPQGAEHYTAIRRTARALEVAFGPGWDVRTQGPIGLDDESEPEPDVAVVSGSLDDYGHAHPSRPVLTVEVAVSSLGVDRQRKGSVYARAGVRLALRPRRGARRRRARHAARRAGGEHSGRAASSLTPQPASGRGSTRMPCSSEKSIRSTEAAASPVPHSIAGAPA